MVRTREKSSLFLIGIGNPETLHKLPKLPTVREALQRCMFLVQDFKRVNQAIQTTTSELLTTWGRTNIPLQTSNNVTVVIRKLYDNWCLVKKNKKKDLERKKKFERKLDTLLDISSRSSEPDDDFSKEFLADQRSGRQFSLAALDGSASRRMSADVVEMEAETSDEDIDIAPSFDPDYVPEPKRVKVDPPVMSSQETPEVLTEDVLSALDRNKVSDREAVKIIMPVVTALNGDGSKMALSRSTVARKRKKARVQIAERAKAEFDPQGPLVVHWDGAKLENVENSSQSERLPVLVSWSEGEKLLGAPAVSPPTGDQERQVVFDLMEKWGCTKKVCGMSFDTTLVNTGKFKGACVKLEQLTGRNLLWLACRHHTHELILAKAFSVCFGASTSPEIPLFKRFRDKWDDIPKEKLKLLVVTKKWRALKTTVVNFLTSFGASDFPRDDYKELLELSLVVLGKKPAKFSFKKPGPVHHARWMAKIIYAIKIFLLQEHGSMYDLTDEELKLIKRFVRFGILLYVKPWLEAPLAADAAMNDFQLWNNIVQYRQTDSKVSSALQQVLERHLWYLSDELVGLSLFSEKVSANEKQNLVRAMQTKPEGERSVVGKPEQFKQGRASLADFATKRSYTIFKKLDIDDSFIGKSPTEWEELDAYRTGLQRVKALKVVNDLAKRGVKLCKDFNKVFTKNPEENQLVLQVVEQNRRDIKTNCTKAELLRKLN